MKTAITLTTVFIIAAAFTVSTNKTAATASTDPISSRNYVQPFNRIVIEDDIDVTLIESPERTIEFDGAKADLAKVNWKIKNGTLYLSGLSGSLKDRVLATIGVKGLTEININGESNVNSLGNICSPELHVYMNGSGRAEIMNKGNIRVINGEGIKLDIRKKTANVKIVRNEI